jgi:hypothetical protein
MAARRSQPASLPASPPRVSLIVFADRLAGALVTAQDRRTLDRARLTSATRLALWIFASRRRERRGRSGSLK